MPLGMAASSSSSSRTWKQTMSTEMPWEEQGGSEGSGEDGDNTHSSPGSPELTVSARRPSMARG